MVYVSVILAFIGVSRRSDMSSFSLSSRKIALTAAAIAAARVHHYWTAAAKERRQISGARDARERLGAKGKK